MGKAANATLDLMTEAPAPPPPAPAAAPSTLLLLVRHGETPTTGTVLPGRAPGLHLSERGRAQAQRIAERLAGLKVDAVYSSPLERTAETAAPAAAGTGLEVNHEPGLIECDFGDWTGAALADLTGLPEWQTVQHAPSVFRFPDGESFARMQARMVETLEALRTTHPGGVVVCFSHADPIKAAVAHALGAHLDLFQRIAISPGSVSVISYTEGQPPAVLTVNSTAGPLAGLRQPRQGAEDVQP
jgi:probable phosphomutase (TIGR03848 family)